MRSSPPHVAGASPHQKGSAADAGAAVEKPTNKGNVFKRDVALVVERLQSCVRAIDTTLAEPRQEIDGFKLTGEKADACLSPLRGAVKTSPVLLKSLLQFLRCSNVLQLVLEVILAAFQFVSQLVRAECGPV